MEDTETRETREWLGRTIYYIELEKCVQNDIKKQIQITVQVSRHKKGQQVNEKQ